eukprot:Phypoly_transcript_15854.p1 GENE.Phypoly_transcript_15854~~Phypoly_transcript_15854.p1  ORF type:complete len:179 (+),score=19.07 Phypoly_transcript_15854:224-760(+)
MLIPVFGWIAGATMLTVSFTALEDNVRNSSYRVDSCQSNVNDAEYYVRQVESNIDNLRAQISRTEAAIKTTENKITELGNKIRDLQKVQKEIAETKIGLSKCVVSIGETHALSNVIHKEISQELVFVNTLVRPLESLAAHFDKLLGLSAGHGNVAQKIKKTIEHISQATIDCDIDCYA